MQLHFAGTHFGQIEYVADKLKQVFAAIQNIFEIFLLLGINRAGLTVHEKLGKTDDAVERCSQFMRHVGEKLAFDMVCFFQQATPFFEPHVFQPELLSQSVLGDVPQNHGEQFRSAVLGLGNRSFDGKLLTTGAHPEDGAKGVRPSVRHVRLAKFSDVSRVCGAKPLRDKPIQRLAEHFRSAIAEHLLRCSVEDHDALLLVHGNNAVHRGADNAGEPLLALKQSFLHDGFYY